MKYIGGHQSFTPRSTTALIGLAILIAGGLGGVCFMIYYFTEPFYGISPYTPVQPIAFSHKLHAGDNQINCQYCHTFARRSEIAGIPSVSTCMNCHTNVKVDSPKIKEVAKYYDENKPIPWIKVFDLPDHVWFNHKRHIAKDIPCQKCHGPVETMEVVAKQVNHRMGFCLKCHQERGAPTDCWTCHT